MATGNLEDDFGRESKRFTDTISKFTQQSSGVTQSVTKFAKATKLSGDVLEKFSGSLKTQLENLSTNINSLSDEIFKSDKPFLIDTQKLNEKIGVAQATIDVLSAKLENSGNEFVKLTESEKEVVKQQIAAAKNLVEQTQAFGFGAKQVLAQLQTRTLSSVEDFTLSQISRIPIIGSFFSGFISDTIKILKTRRIERAKAAKETLLQEAKEKAQREADIDFLVNSGAVKDRQEAERKLLQERENNIKQERIKAELEQLKEFKERGLISEKEFKQNQKRVSTDGPQSVKIDESNADDVIETVSLSDDAVEGLGDSFKSGVVEGTSSAITSTLLPGFKSALVKTLGFLLLPLKAIRLGISKLVAIFKPMDTSRLKEMKSKALVTTDQKEQTQDEEGKGFLGGLAKTFALAGFSSPLIIAGGKALGIAIAAVGGGIGTFIAALGAGGAFAISILSDALKELAEDMKFLTPQLKDLEEVDGEKLRNTASGIGSLGGALAKFGGGGLVQSFSSAVQGIVGLFTDSPLEQIQEFSKLGDDVQKTADALEDATPKLEKFYNMLSGKNFDSMNGFTKFTENFLESSQNIVKAFKGGRNVVSGAFFKGLEDIRVDSIDQVKGLIDSVANLSRANLINNLSLENQLMRVPSVDNRPPFLSSNIINQNNNQGVVINKSVNNDNLDNKILARYS